MFNVSKLCLCDCFKVVGKIVHVCLYIKFQYIYPAVTINGQDRRGLLGADHCCQGRTFPSHFTGAAGVKAGVGVKL